MTSVERVGEDDLCREGGGRMTSEGEGADWLLWGAGRPNHPAVGSPVDPTLSDVSKTCT